VEQALPPRRVAAQHLDHAPILITDEPNQPVGLYPIGATST
jgi:hypothetical protein